MPVELSQEEKDLLAAGADYGALSRSEGWRRLMDFLILRLEAAQGRVFDYAGNDREIEAGLTREWRLRGKFLSELTEEVLGTVKHAEEFQKQLKEQDDRDQHTATTRDNEYTY